MQVTIQYEAQARRAVGARSETIEFSESIRLNDCIRHVAEVHADPLHSILLKSDGNVQPSLLIFVNDAHVAPGDDVTLSDGDTLTLMTPISGG